MLDVVTPTNDARFRRAYTDNFDAISRYCLRRLPAHDARDAVAETFAVAWRRIDAMPDGEATLPWLYGVARNVVRNIERSQRRTTRLRGKLAGLGRAAGDSPETIVIRRAEDEALLRAMEALRPADREVLRLRAYEGLTTAQLAAALGVSEEAAKKRATRALQRLRKVLGESAESGGEGSDA